MLRRATRREDLRFPPGNRLEKLKGDRAGQDSGVRPHSSPSPPPRARRTRPGPGVRRTGGGPQATPGRERRQAEPASDVQLYLLAAGGVDRLQLPHFQRLGAPFYTGERDEPTHGAHLPLALHQPESSRIFV
jgi:hypothetical protein